MPVGVKIVTSLRTGPTNPVGPESSSFFVVGVTERGPVDGDIPAVHNITEFTTVWGDRTSFSGTVFDQAMTYFAEGGNRLYVGRVVGTSAVRSSLSLVDSTTAPGAATLKVQAKNPGDYGDQLQVEVYPGTLPNTFSIRVYVGTEVVETYPELASPTAAVNAMLSSRLVNVTNQGSLAVAPANNPKPVPKTALAGGTDDRATITSASVLAVLTSQLPKELGPGAIAVPGYTADLVGPALAAHCITNLRVGLLAGPLGASTAQLGSLAGGLTGYGEYLGLFAPWVIIPDGSSSRTISPEGYVAGVRSRAQSVEDAFWQAPPGARATARFVKGTPTPLDTDDVNDLDAVRVSGISTSHGNVRLYNWRSLSTDENQWSLLSSRDTINALAARLELAMDPYVWEVIDGKHQLESVVAGQLVGVLQPVSDSGGLYAEYNDDGSEIHPGYTVAVNASADQLGRNVLAAQVQVKLSPYAALIVIELIKASFTAPLV